MSPVQRKHTHTDTHWIFFPHNFFNHIQTRIGNHLDHVSVLSTAHPRSATRRVLLHGTRRPRQCSQCACKRRRRPCRQTRRQRRRRCGCWLGRIMGERVDRGVGRREDEEVVGHGVGWLVG